jgi:MFS family permease
MLLPRLRPSIGTYLFAHRHVLLRAGVHIPDSVQLAHGLAQETLFTRQLTTMEGVLIAFLTPILGWLIDVYGSSDRVLILGGLCFLLGLTVLAFVRVLWSLKHTQHAQVARSSSQKSTARSWRPAYSPVRLAW